MMVFYLLHDPCGTLGYPWTTSVADDSRSIVVPLNFFLPLLLLASVAMIATTRVVFVVVDVDDDCR